MLVTGTRATFAFLCRGYGWTITLYLPTYSTGFTTEQPKANALASKMYQSTNKDTQITYIRLQNASQLRQGKLLIPTLTGGNSQQSVQPQSCAYMRLYNAQFTMSKLIFWRGLYQNAVINGGQTNPTSPWATDAPTVWAQMAADGWCWLGKDPTSLPPQPVSAVAANAGGFPQITFAAPVFSAFNVNGSVKAPLALSGLKGCDTLNGNWVVYALTATTCTFTKQVLFNPWVQPSGHGYSDKVMLVPIADGLIERYAERKCGRPLYLSRGRSNRKKVVF